MLDIHATTLSGGGTSLTAITTIPTGDGSQATGTGQTPISPKATLVAWGVLTINNTDFLEEVQLLSQDQVDPINGEDIKIVEVAANTPHTITQFTNIPYATGARKISADQDAGGNEFAMYLDYYADDSPLPCVDGNEHAKFQVKISQAFGGALTALAWGTQAFSPATVPPVGKYAILGYTAVGFTSNGLVRYQHADFGQYSPGLPTCSIGSSIGQALEAVWFDGYPGLQFVKAGQYFKKPCCPQFRITATGSQLNIQALSNSTDTPTVVTHLAYMGGL